MLFGRLHENVLSNFGFKRSAPTMASSNLQRSNVNTNSNLNTSTLTNDRDKSADRLPPRGHQNTITVPELRPSNLPNNKGKSPIPAPFIQQPKEQHHVVHSRVQSDEEMVMVRKSHAPVVEEVEKNPFEIQNLNTNLYPAPHPASPLGKQLSKLLPPNEATNSFFNTLFQEPSEKIINELE